MSTHRLPLIAACAALLSLPASAQLVPDLGGVTHGTGLLPPLPRIDVPVVGDLLEREPQAAELATPTLSRVGQSGISARLGRRDLERLREARLEKLIDDYPAELDRDRDDYPVRRGELLLVDPDAAGVATARAAGFSQVEETRLDALGVRLVTLAIPAQDEDVRDAIKRLRKAAPDLVIDYNHVFEPAGGGLAPMTGAAAATGQPRAASGTIAIIDGGVASHPSLSAANLRQRAFASQVVPTGHGTAVASLVVGNEGAFRGASRGTRLLVADIYGGSPAAGSASAIANAIAWAVAEKADVINISLVGPRNALVERAIAGARRRGVEVVAAVGNDGPAAPDPYPASYAGVVAITGVDEHGRALREAGRTDNLAFAAPGADLAAARPGGGYIEVRGTSFAAPLASARLLARGNVISLGREAVKGKGRVGRGIVCMPCRIDPDQVGAK
ncbi:MAG: serine protease [Sphingomonadaceae bacterium]|nr:MAG: serine protease [Sphingomonadaceae bacterium]